MRRLNLLIYEPYPFDQISGNLKVLSYILHYLNKQKFRPVLVAPFRTNFLAEWERRGIDCYTIAPSPRLTRYGGSCLSDSIFGKVKTTLDLCAYNFQLMTFIKKNNIDVIYSNCIRTLLTTAIAAQLSRTPIFWYIKGELQNSMFDTFGFIVAKRIAFQCESNRDDKYNLLTKLFKRKIDIVKSGVDLPEILSVEQSDHCLVRKKLQINTSNINIVVLGQISPGKGVDHLLRAFSIISKEFPNARLYVVGDYIINEFKLYAESLMMMVRILELDDKVRFTGWIDNGVEVLSVMDILVHPSLSEGMPGAVMEAMALGKPVIATRVGGCREIIKDGINGLLVEPGDSQQIISKLRMLMYDSQLREHIGRAARETMIKDYLIPDKVRQLEQIWTQMCL